MIKISPEEFHSAMQTAKFKSTALEHSEVVPQNLEQDISVTPTPEKKQDLGMQYIPPSSEYTPMQANPVEITRNTKAIEKSLRQTTELNPQSRRVFAQTELDQLQQNSHDEYADNVETLKDKPSHLPFEDDRDYEPR